MIALSRVTVTVGVSTLLDDVSFELSSGELLAVVGPNGAGKSTLASVVAGDRTTARGSVDAFGRALSSWSLAELALRRAVVRQSSQLAFDVSAFDVVLLGRLPHPSRGETPRDIEIVEQAMEATETWQLATRPMSSLSGGERQRVHLARAMAQLSGAPRPSLLILDEPTSNLDLRHQHVSLRLARDLIEQGVGVLCVLHDLNLAARYADRTLVMSRGRVAALGPPSNVLTRELIASVFGVDVVSVTHDDLPGSVLVSRGPTSSPPTQPTTRNR